MREIKFRGKASKDWNDNFHQQKFIYGSLILCEDEITSTIINREFEAQVDTNTVGEFTGLFDKNGKEIYEGDILQHPDGEKFTVVYKLNYAAFRAVYSHDCSNLALQIYRKGEAVVIGNVYENLELLTNQK